MIVRPEKSRTADQTTFIDQLRKSDPTAATTSRHHLVLFRATGEENLD